jgi:hypothetical protein
MMKVCIHMVQHDVANKKQYFALIPQSLLFGAFTNLTNNDTHVLSILMAICYDDGPHEIDLRELGSLARVSASILCDTGPDAKVPRKGILTRLQEEGCITLIYGRRKKHGRPSGNVKTFIVVNHSVIWQRHQEWCESERKKIAPDSYRVTMDDIEIAEPRSSKKAAIKPDHSANKPDQSANKRDSKVNKDVRTANKPARKVIPFPGTDTNSIEANKNNNCNITNNLDGATAPSVTASPPVDDSEENASGKKGGNKRIKLTEEQEQQAKDIKQRLLRLRGGKELPTKKEVINENQHVRKLISEYGYNDTLKICTYLVTRHWRWSQPENKYKLSAYNVYQEANAVLLALNPPGTSAFEESYPEPPPPPQEDEEMVEWEGRLMPVLEAIKLGYSDIALSPQAQEFQALQEAKRKAGILV